MQLLGQLTGKEAVHDESTPDMATQKISRTDLESGTRAETPERLKLAIHVENALQRYQEILEHGGPRRGLSTGLSLLDVMTNGLMPGNVYVIASRPSMGKTTLLLNILSQVAINQKTPSLFFSGDLTSSQIVDRLIFNRAMAPLDAHFDPEHIPSKIDLINILKCARELAEMQRISGPFVV